MAEKKLYFSQITVELNSANYSKIIEKNDESNKELKVLTRDFYDIISISNEKFAIKYTRKVELEPKVLFEINVSFDLTFYFDKKTIKEYEENFAELSTLVNEKIIKAIDMTGVIPKASALITSLTLCNGGNPIITPPNFQR